MIVILSQGFESDSQRLIINQLGTAHEDLKDVTWFSWDTFCVIYSVSTIRIPVTLHVHLLNQLGPNAST